MTTKKQADSSRHLDDHLFEDNSSPLNRKTAHSFRSGLVSFLIYLGLSIVAFWHVWSTHPSAVTIGGGDTYLDSWFLASMTHSILHFQNPFFSNYANYPFGINLMDNSSVMALGLITMPITMLFGPIASFNLIVTASLFVSATAGYVAMRRFCTWAPAAFLGGLAYGFSSYMIAQVNDGHIHIVFLPLPPLIFLLLHDITVHRVDRWVRNGIWLGLLVVIQFFLSTEILALCAIVAFVVLVLGAIVGHRTLASRFIRIVKSGVVAGCLSALALAYPAWFFLRGTGHIRGPVQLNAQAYREDLSQFVIPSSHYFGATYFSTTVAHFTAPNEVYLGIFFLVILIVGIWWVRHKKVALITTGAALTAGIFSLGSTLVFTGASLKPTGAARGTISLPESFFSRFSILSSLLPTRFAFLFDLFAAVIFALVIDAIYLRLRFKNVTDTTQDGLEDEKRVGAKVPKKRVLFATSCAGLIAALGVLAIIPKLPLQEAVFDGVPAYFTTHTHPQIPTGSVAMLFPYPSNEAPQVEAWQATEGLSFRMLGGYFLVANQSGTIAFTKGIGYTRDTVLARVMTSVQEGTIPTETKSERSLLVEQLVSNHVQSVIATPQDGANPLLVTHFFRWLLGPPTSRDGGTVDWYHLDLAKGK